MLRHKKNKKKYKMKTFQHNLKINKFVQSEIFMRFGVEDSE